MCHHSGQALCIAFINVWMMKLFYLNCDPPVAVDCEAADSSCCRYISIN